MDELPMHLAAGPLSAWGDDQVQRAYALTVRHLRTLLDGGPVEDVQSAEEEAAMFGEELLRRGLL